MQPNLRILLVNGNTTQAVTSGIEASAKEAALPGTEVRAVTPTSGPATVEGYLDGQLSAIGVCETIAAYQEQADAFVIACFSDPGLYASRELSTRPVVGIAEAAMVTAIQLGHRFGLLTPQRRLRPVLEGLVHLYGFTNRLAGVQVVDISVNDARTLSDRQMRFLEAGRRSLTEDGAEVVILAGAVLSGMEIGLGRELQVPVLDPVKCAVAQAQALSLLQLTTSRAGGFDHPLPKDCLNCSPEILARVYRSDAA